ncbi:RICIN domain-containing protein [Streptomyces netropsis]|uniref:RICIN domain-containing protein n=1 Tax=Streptomyces netropsis TaxID=55404 RepID=UPI0030CBD5F6
MYDDADFNTRGGGWGRVLISNQSVPDLKALGFNDHASSVYNLISPAILLYSEAEHGGNRLELRHGQHVQDLSGLGMSSSTRWYADGSTETTSWTDQISSVDLGMARGAPVLPNGVYTVTNLASGKVLDVVGGSQANGANVQQWEDNGTDAQKWRFTAL